MNILTDSEVKTILTEFPLSLDSNNPKHIIVFKRLLEWSQANYYWNGEMPRNV